MSIDLTHYINHPMELSKESLYELRNLVAQYPYFQTARLLYLQNLYLLHDPLFGPELRKASLLVGDRRTLFYLIEGKNLVSQSQNVATDRSGNNPEPRLDKTLALIEAFLATSPEENDLPTELTYMYDYTAVLVDKPAMEQKNDTQSNPSPSLIGANLIDQFIEKAESESSIRLTPLTDEEAQQVPIPLSVSHGEMDENAYLTETLAKIYIKQHRYAKALEIIQKIYLKDPNKNAYFADQIRFLQKLIINANSK